MLKKRLKIYPSNYQNQGMRESQQDSFAISNLENNKQVKKKGVAAVLADGMGGLEKGGEASKVAVSAFLSRYLELDSNAPITHKMLQALFVANNAVFDLALQDGVSYDLGTTLSAVIIHENSLFWVSVGDSRVYLFRRGELKQLTMDHVYANHLKLELEKGLISEEYADDHPEKDHLTSYLGLEKLPEVDYNETPFQLAQGDIIMLCSDGLYDVLTEDEIRFILSRRSIQHSAEQLVNAALNKGIEYQDNVTVVNLHCDK